MTPPTPLVHTRRVGRFVVREIQAGGQQLDGGQPLVKVDPA